MLTIAWHSMRVNAILEYHGAYAGWRSIMNYFFPGEENETDGAPDNNDITIERLISYMKRRVYVDFAHNKLYPGRPLPLTQLYTFCASMNIHQLTRLFPIDLRVKAIHHTTRDDYRRERWEYRLAHQIANSGSDLKKHVYEEYKCIAQKYSWPFIVNSNDTEA
jgi:hypothetical protein